MLYNTLLQPSVASATLSTCTTPQTLTLRHDDPNTPVAIIKAFAGP